MAVRRQIVLSDIKPDDGHIWPKNVVLILTLKNIRLLYRVSQEECARFREGVPYVKIYRYNP